MLGVTALRRTAVAPSVLRRAVSSSLGGVSAQRANNHTLAALTNNNSKRPNVPVSYVAAVESPSGFSDVAAPSVITRTLSTTTTPSPSAGGNTVEVSQPGMLTLVQDYPGRTGYWRVGVPPSGPMDHFSFRLANRLVGNDVGAAALEITFAGPTLKFNNDTLIALTGAKVTAELDGKEVPSYKSIKVSKGSTLTINAIDSAGTRAYLAIGGGIEASDYLGSKATFPLGALGGPFEGRGLKAGDVLTFGAPKTSALTEQSLPEELIPKFSNEWEISATLGPQEAPDYFTTEDIEQFFNHTWEVSHNASRLGVRLNGPKPKFTRTDGGEGGSHPSNLLDNAYAIGSINFTGDHPVVLMVDGPSLGGFVCPVTIPHYELWKIGQVRPADKIRFKKITLEQAIKGRRELEEVIQTLSKPSSSTIGVPLQTSGASIPEKAVLKVIEATAKTPKVQYRLAGDRYLLVEYGEPFLDINLRVRVHSLETFLRSRKLNGLIDTIPGVRTLLIEYDIAKLALPDLLKILVDSEKELPPSEDIVLPSRTFHLPMAFRDKWTRAAIDKYMNTVRNEAPYLPDNVEFIARNNGLKSADEVRDIVFSTNYMVYGLGDVYLGAPCAVPLDPRQRLVVPKYNPARTFTPEGAVGIGGAFMCIYPMESPGGYQLIGRTLPIWNTKGNLHGFNKEKPWLLDMFDQVKFYHVTESELESQRSAFSKGDLKLKIDDGKFNVKEYNAFVKSVQSETNAFKERQAKAQAIELQKDAEILQRIGLTQAAATKVVTYLAEMAINGPDHPGAIGEPPSNTLPIIPPPSADYPPGKARSSLTPPRGLKQLFDEQGPEAFARAVRNNKGLLITDTTWRDAHQSLLATRVRTHDLEKIALATSHVLHNAYSLECWGGATFDVAMRFLHECPWDRLAKLRELVPNVPFQMLLRGASAVGYTNYPDNVVYHFCKKAKETGMDVFRIFDSLNYVDNLKLGIDAVGAAGGIVEAAISYTGDITNPNKKKYTLEYYLNLARELVQHGVHVLCIKDMAGLLKPTAARMLIGALRKEFPNVPIHVHTHDTAGTGVASMLACYEAGADAVDCANDALSGLTSQPAMGAIVNDLVYTDGHTGVDPAEMLHLTTYWEGTRRLYAPFETGQKSAGSDVYLNEIPGGQYTNMQFQALSLGLAGEWDSIKKAYADANQILGDIVKVTPSSKVVGDLAQFMVTNKLTKQAVLDQAAELNFPSSVVDYLQGGLGIPPGGFPEPFRSKVLKNLPRYEGRAGASMKPFDFEKLRVQLEKEHQGYEIKDVDLSSAAQYPKVFKDFMEIKKKYGNITNLPTRFFLAPMNVGDEVSFQESGKSFKAKLLRIGELDKDGKYPVEFELNGQTQTITIKPKKAGQPPFIQRGATKTTTASTQTVAKEKADKSRPGHVGAPMPGKVLSVAAETGKNVNKGDTIAVLSAMKMETVVTAPISGKVTRVLVAADDSISAGDLLLEIQA